MNKQREQALIEIIDDLLWMSVRYADGRNDHAPNLVRENVQRMKTMYPLWSVKEDKTLHPPQTLRKENYLWDIFNPRQ